MRAGEGDGRPGPAIIGHRGGNEGPQNSLAAVRAANRSGADGVEIDVQVAPDGEVVAGHDLLDAAAPTGPDLTDRLRLTELLAEVEELGIELVLDVKSAGDPVGEAAALADVLAAASRPELVTVSSFSVPVLQRLRQLDLGFPLVPIVSLRQNFPAPDPADGWAGLSVLAAALVANPLLAGRVRRRGGLLLVWFAATEWSLAIRAAARLDPDGLIVADITRALDALDRRS